MNVAEKIIQSSIINHPWHHKIIDNFLPVDVFNVIQNDAEKLFQKFKSNNINSHATQIFELSQFESSSYKIHQVNKILMDNIDAILESFPYARKYDTYISIPSLYCFEPNSGIAEVHDESFDKSLSIVVYLYPEQSTGTLLYKSKTDFSHEVDWCQNRAMIFCGQKNVTWHTFASKNQPRLTLNFFLRNKFVKKISVRQRNIQVIELDDSEYTLPLTTVFLRYVSNLQQIQIKTLE